MSNNFSVPSNTHPVLNPDGTMNRIWYNYLQGLSGVAAGPQVGTVAAETKPPANPAIEDNVAEPSAHAPVSSTPSQVGSTEHHTEPTQNVGNVIAIVEQVLQNYALIP